jgi:hypothetical protein
MVHTRTESRSQILDAVGIDVAIDLLEEKRRRLSQRHTFDHDQLELSLQFTTDRSQIEIPLES